MDMPVLRKKHTSGKQYLLNLQKWRSRTAILACLITFAAAMYAVAGGLVLYAQDGESPLGLMQYFTTNSNILTAVSALMILPFAIEGIRKKRFSYPKWAAMLHFAGTICTTLTMIFAICFISWNNPTFAFGGYNFLLHVVCPAMVLISFFMVESDFHYSIRDVLLCMIPFFLYGIVYFFNVVILGPEHGGWQDLYALTSFLPAYISGPLMCLLAFGVAMAIRAVYHRIGQQRRTQLMKRWSAEMDPVEIRIELYGLGRYMGAHEDEHFAVLPLDIIRMLGDRYRLSEEELIRPYIRGLLDARKEHRSAGE